MSATKKFNPLKDFSTVTPPYEGAVYYQDGNYFNGDGGFVFADESSKSTSSTSGGGIAFPDAESPDADRDYEDKRPLTDSHPNLTREQREEAADASAAQAASGTTTTTKTADEPAHASEFDGVNPKKGLTAWLKGEIDPKPTMPVVRDWVKQEYSQVLGNKDEIITFLVEEKNLVPAEQVKA